MREAFPGAGFVPRYTPAERAAAVRRTLPLPSPPSLGPPVALTPSSSYAKDGSHLSFWKPSFVIGTPQGGEAAVNLWGLYSQGHVDLAFAPRARSYLLDCRLLSRGPIVYKVYAGPGGVPSAHGEASLNEGHLLLEIGVPDAGGPVSAEIWPSSDTAALGFLGCDLGTMDRPLP